MRNGLIAAALVLLAATSASAQTSDEQLLLDVIKTLSQRVDALQARLDAQGVPAAAYIDIVNVRDDQKIEIAGWALACNEPQPKVTIVVDDLEVPDSLRVLTRVPRPDVAALAGPWCAIPPDAGLIALVDWTAFLPTLGGSKGDLTHRVKIRVYDQYKRARESQTVTVTIPLLPAKR